MKIRLPILASTLALMAMVALTPAAFAANNNQSGLVNVNLQTIALAVPVSVAVPVGVAANVCPTVDAALLAAAAQNGTATCDATSNSTALSTAIADAMTGTGGGADNNRQAGLVNVNVQGLALALPVSVALPIGVAANVCGVNAAVLAAANQTGSAQCTADPTSTALSQAIASA